MGRNGNMNRKIIGAILCIAIFMLGAIPVTSLSVQTEKVKDQVNEKSIELKDDDPLSGEYSFFTWGSINNQYVELGSLEGNETIVSLIMNCWDKKPPAIAKFLPGFPILVMDSISFTVNYRKDLAREVRNRNWYTTLSKINETGENETYFLNEKHNVKVTNFTGMFIYIRPKLVRGVLPRPINLLWPARFIFSGYADNVEYLD
jgi:hypothetical protein